MRRKKRIFTLVVCLTFLISSLPKGDIFSELIFNQKVYAKTKQHIKIHNKKSDTSYKNNLSTNKKNKGETTNKIQENKEYNLLPVIPNQKHNDKRIIVKYKSKNTYSRPKREYSLESKSLNINTSTNEKFENNDIGLIELAKDSDINEVINEINKNPDVEYAQPDYELSTFELKEKNNKQQPSLDKEKISNINIENAWNITKGSEEVLIGVLDTGIDISHSDLKEHIYINQKEIPNNGIDDDHNGYVDDVNGWDFINNDNSVYDSVSSDAHGTSISGVIAKLAPNVKIVPLKFISGDTGYTSDAIKAIEYAKKLGIKVINCSWGSFQFNQALKEVMGKSDILFSGSAGNDGVDSAEYPVYPASYDLTNIISVGATYNNGNLAIFSNYGEDVHIAAPGKNILSTSPNNGYEYLSGTSMSAAIVTGIAALLQSNMPNYTSSEIAVKIKKNVTVNPSLENIVATSGIINAEAVLKDTSKIENINYLVQDNDINSSIDNSSTAVNTLFDVDEELMEQLHYGEDGINPASGNYSCTYNDMSIFLGEKEFSFGRIYNSKNNDSSDFSRGWTFSFESFAYDMDSLVEIILPNSSKEIFCKDNNGNYISNYSRNKVEKLEDNSINLITPDKTVYHYIDNLLDKITDKNGNTITIEYNDSYDISKISSSIGKYFDLEYNKYGKLVKITDSSGRSVIYEYDNYLLSNVIAPSGETTKYFYDTEDYLSEIKDNDNNILQRITYKHDENNSLNGYVMELENKFGNVYSYYYDLSDQKTEVIDTKNRKITYWFDNAMYTVKTKDPEGKITTAEYYKTGYTSKYISSKECSRTKLSTGTLDGKLFFLGGWANTGGGGYVQPNVTTYDTNSNYWHEDPHNMLTRRKNIKTVELKGSLYALGGDNSIFDKPLGSVEVYEKQTNLWDNPWSKKADMPTPRYGFSANSANGKIYTIGGSVSGNRLKIVEEYNPATNKWKRKRDTLSYRDYAKAISYENKIYLIGGFDQYEDGGQDVSNKVEEYDPLTDTWIEKSNVPLMGKHYVINPFLINDKIYAVQEVFDMYNDIYDIAEYDIQTDTWKTLTRAVLPGEPTIELNNKIYCIITKGHSDYYNILTEYEIPGNSRGEIKSITDRNGNTFKYIRDVNGNIIKKINPDDTFKEYAYDDKNNLTMEKDELGKTTWYIYDENKENLIKEVKPLNGTDKYIKGISNDEDYIIISYEYYPDKESESLGYNQKGLVKTVTDPMGNITTYSYDSDGNIKTITDCDGNTITNEYNNIGLKVSSLSPKGNKTNYSYDLNNQVEKIEINNLDDVTKNSINRIDYDLMGRKIKEITPNQYKPTLDDLSNHKYSGDDGTKYTYNSNGTLKEVTDAEGNKIIYDSYDLYGNVLSETRPNGSVYKYKYDKMNRLSQVKFKENSSGVSKLLKYTYATLNDGYKQITEIKYLSDTQTSITKYKYDFADRLVEQVNPDDTVLKTVYNANGTINSKIDSNNNISYFYYDGINRLIEERIPFEMNNGKIYYTIKKYEYDKNGNIILDTITTNKPGESEMADKIGYEYNNTNKLVKVINYDRNLPVNYTQYYYNEEGNKIRMYTGLSEPLTINGVDEVTANGDDNYSVTKFEYNHLGKINAITDPMGMKETYIYDLNGNLIQKKDKNGNTISYSYDDIDRELSRTVVNKDSLNNVTYNFTYGKSGKIEKITGGERTESYEYDGMGNLISATENNDVVKEYTYDLTGNRKSYSLKVDDELRINTTYDYDDMSRLHNVYENNKLLATYNYDNNGNRKSLSYTNGNNITYEYNLANKVRMLTNKDNEDIISQYVYDYYLDGTIDSENDSINGTTTYRYDGLNRLSHEIQPDGTSINYTFDDYNNRKSMIVSGSIKDSTTTYHYDKNNRLITEDNSISGITNYAYDNNGNQISKGDDIYTYDGFNRLVNINQPEHTIGYTYNPHGLRTSKIIDGIKTSFIWDGQNISMEFTENDEQKYIRGINLISSQNALNNKFYLYNAHGDVVQLLGAEKNDIIKYDYDSFGNQDNIDPIDTNPFRYSGEYFDKETGIIYLRARYYNQSNGRFLTADSFTGNLNDPLSLNRYTYCANNPLAYIDPTGHSFWPTEEEWNKLFNDTQAFLLGVDEATTGGTLLKLGQNIRKFFGADYIKDKEIARAYKEDGTFRENYEMGEFYGALGTFTKMGGGMNNSFQPSLVTTNGIVMESGVTTTIDLSWILYANNDLPSRNGALNKAKRDAGVPRNQAPDKIKSVAMRTAEYEGGHAIKDNNGNVIFTREYYYTNTDGVQLIIQEHSAGHTKGGQGPHFNVRPIKKPRSGTFYGTLDHYPFK